MRVKIIILALVICFAFLPIFQVQGQVNSKPTILDVTQGTPITGEDFTIDFLVSDDDGVDTVRTYVYFKIFDGVSTPEYPAVTQTSLGVYESTVSVPINASDMYYTISANDGYGLWGISDVLNRNVVDNVNPQAAIQSSVNAVLETPYQFNGSSSLDNVGIAYYNWTFVHDGESITLNGMEPVFNFTKYGTYTITLKVTDACGNFDTTLISVLTIDGINPVSNPGIDMFVIVGQLIEIDGSGSTDNTGIEEYAWSFYHNGTLITLSGQNPEFRFWEVGEYNITLNVIDAAGNNDQKSITVHVLHDDTAVPYEIPWWSIVVMIMVLAVMITTVYIFKTSND